MRDGEIELRLLRPGDDAAIAALLEEPAVKRWWSDGEYEREHGWVVEVDGAFAGWIQYEEETAPAYRSVAFDLSLTTGLHGRGVGRRVLQLAIRHFVEKGHHRFTIDPDVANERAIRCYAGAGFKPVGVMRAYERTAAGDWHDSLLMDLVVIDGEWR
jgi:aminoglycoside 6'-N-acetyltransferase